MKYSKFRFILSLIIISFALLATWTMCWYSDSLMPAQRILLFLVCIWGLFLLVMCIYLYARTKYYKAKVSGSIFGIYIFVFLCISFAMWMIPAEDHFADDLIISDTLQFFQPIDGNDKEIKSDSMDFQLFNYGQAGVFTYAVFLPDIEEGHVYIKAFEVLNDIPLSDISMKRESMVKVGSISNGIMKYESTNLLIIYEGDPGHPYIARFEVWFIPSDNKNEIKLMEKNYIIEGRE